MTTTARPAKSNLFLFLFFWLLVFVLYLPAMYAGLVSDTTGWLQDIQQSSFADHINRVHFKVQSLYQFTQLVTWFFYQLFGTNAMLWHCLHVTFHAFNCVLLFRVASGILDKDKVPHARLIVYCGCILFCLMPSLSEVIVWEASFHYLLGLLLLLSILRLLQAYMAAPANDRLLLILWLYLLSTYSIELFYVTPFFIAGLLLFYYQAFPVTVRKVAPRLLLPMLALLLLHFVQVKLAYGHWLPHISADVLNATSHRVLWAKPLKYMFHLLLLGRFYPQDIREKVYALCESYPLIIGFYGLLVLITAWGLSRWRRDDVKPGLLFLYWSVLTMGLIVPLWFPQMFWVEYDRYGYFFTAFFFMLLSYVLFRIVNRRIAVVLLVLFGLANMLATYKVNKKWGNTAVMIDSLMKGLPVTSDQTVLLLNMPQCMNGLFMITGGHCNEAQTMHDVLYQPPLPYKLRDVCAYNILSVKDGAHVEVLNDSTLKVTLNQWGTWWWFDGMGAANYENEYYRVDMKDPGHYYELTLKGDPSAYKLLFQNGSSWQTVDMSRKNVEQY